MERRALIAGLICIIIVLGYQEIVNRLYPPPDPALNPPIEATPGAPPVEPVERADQQPPPPVLTEPASSAVVEGQDITIDTDLYHAVFTTAGARLKSFQLKRFRTTVDPDSPLLDLMAQAVPADRPLGIELRGAKQGPDQKQVIAVTDTGVLYTVDRQSLELQGADAGSITFTGDVRGTRIVKRLEAVGNSYLFDIAVRAENVPPDFTELGINWNKQLDDTKAHGGEIVFNSDVMLQGGKIHRELFTALHEPLSFQDNIQWTGYDGHYFLAAMVPSGDGTNNLRVWIRRSGDKLENKLLLPPNQFEYSLSAFLGPKDVDVLTRDGHELKRAVDLGYFAFVALPLFQVLKFLYRFTGNYGVDIILLTVAIKILFIPLTQKSLKSMREMQKLQPQMQQLRERYKDKPDEMNKEIMELYRRHKVNPLGGCLPMVLQIPVFIGLYNALSNAVELRHAPFMLWINDLSAPDRLGNFQLPFVDRPGFPVLTLAMGGTMFLQQWMTPSTADPAQQRIMLIMPVMFTVMFINFPSGLTLYWLVNNILTIAQQYWINRSKD